GSLRDRMGVYLPSIYQAVHDASTQFHALLQALAESSEADVAALAVRRLNQFFYDPSEPGHDENPVLLALERALAIEVIRRALSSDEDIDTAEPLAFAQLT